MSTHEIIEEFGTLSLEDKLKLLDTLWHQVAPSEQSLPLTDADRQALSERLRDIESDPRPPRPLDDAVRALHHRQRR